MGRSKNTFLDIYNPFLRYVYKNDKMKFEFSLQNLKKEFIKNGLTNVNTEFDDKSETIMIQFYAE